MNTYGQWALNTAVNYLGFYAMMYGDRLPTKAGLCRALDVSMTTLYNWCEVHPEFGHVVNQMKLEKERQTINFGLDGRFNATIAKVLLAEDGYGDRTTLDITDEAMKNLSDAELQYLAKHGRLPSSS